MAKSGRTGGWRSGDRCIAARGPAVSGLVFVQQLAFTSYRVVTLLSPIDGSPSGAFTQASFFMILKSVADRLVDPVGAAYVDQDEMIIERIHAFPSGCVDYIARGEGTHAAFDGHLYGPAINTISDYTLNPGVFGVRYEKRLLHQRLIAF